MLSRDFREPTSWDRVRGGAKRAAGEAVRWGWRWVVELGAIGPDTRAGRRFGAFGRGSVICFPTNTLFNEQYIQIGEGTMIGPQVTLSAGMVPGQACVTNPVVRIGDRCLIGKGSGIVGHLAIEIGNDVWTGHHVYITDQNHGFADIELPISRQSMPEEPVTIGDGSWLGHGTVVLPVPASGGTSPSARTVSSWANCPITPSPSVHRRVVRRFVEGEGWVKV